MIVGGYTLDLYCDRKDCVHAYNPEWNPREYIGEHGSSCRAQARRDGWLLSRVHDGGATCPECKHKAPAPPAPPPTPAGKPREE